MVTIRTMGKRKTKARPPVRRSLSAAQQSLSALPVKLQLSMLNSGLLSTAEQEKAISNIPLKPVELNQWTKYMNQKRKYPVLYRAEWQMLTKVETHSMRHSTKPSNEIKNQNKKIVPYDYNRVVLEPLFGIPDTDYINASYIDSILKPNAYIVTQGPNEKTMNDLWRMVWQENAPCIIMLTKTFDFIKVMCNQYWPKIQTDKTLQYGMIQVTVEKEDHLANFIVRTIRMKKGDEERPVFHFHYTGWPSHCCPYANALLEFRRRVRAFINSIPNPGPIVVHCNDGAGRSGVFLAVDANLELGEEDGMYDVFNYVKKLRSSRKGLVESLEQYKFIYETLEEHVNCGHSWFPVADLSQKMKFKAQKHGIKRQNEFQREFKQVLKATPKFTIGDCAGGHRLENREKNRDIVTVPPDNFRPYLSSFQGNDFTDYINAVVVDGYMRTKEYVVTEWPMRHTVGDFWSLVYDHDCNSVVILCNPTPNATTGEEQETEPEPPPEKKEAPKLVKDPAKAYKESVKKAKAEAKAAKDSGDPVKQYPSFWPENCKSKKYGPIFTIDLVSSNHYPNVKTWIFKINKKLPTASTSVAVSIEEDDKDEVVSLQELMAGIKAEAKTVQFFQFLCWPMGHKVPTSTNALVELMNMVERWRQRSDFGPIVVVSNNGRSRAGVFCAANSAIEQVAQHKEVDVFQCVKTIRRHRPQLVENMTEYKYCYDLVLHYVLQNSAHLVQNSAHLVQNSAHLVEK